MTPWNRMRGAGYRGRVLSFSQDFLPVANERGKQIADDATRVGLDLDRNGHAGQKLDGPALDLHLRAIEYDARGVGQLLAVGFTRGALRPGRRRPGRLFASVARDGVARNAVHPPVQEAITREIERIDLDLGILPG